MCSNVHFAITGYDFVMAMEKIQYQRYCLEQKTSSQVRDLVAFHVFFEAEHFPERSEVEMWQTLLGEDKEHNCSSRPSQPENLKTYKERYGLVYPVNVARNVAREMATTAFVFPIDSELYPSPNVIPKFLAMIRENGPALRTPNPKGSIF